MIQDSEKDYDILEKLIIEILKTKNFSLSILCRKTPSFRARM